MEKRIAKSCYKVIYAYFVPLFGTGESVFFEIFIESRNDEGAEAF